MNNINTHSIAQYLSRVALFTSIPEDARQTLAKKIDILHLKAEEILFQEGDPPDSMYILVTGKLLSFHAESKSKSKNIGNIYPSETVGELSVISGETRSLSVRAIADSSLIKIPAEEFLYLCHEYPELHQEVSKLIAERSYSNIKSLIYEKLKSNVIIMLPLLGKSSAKVIYEKFLELTPNDLKIYSCEKTPVSSLSHLTEEHQERGETFLLLMEHWSSSITKNLSNNIKCFYIVFYSDQDDFLSNETKLILEELERYKNIALKIILIHPDNTKMPHDTKKFLRIANFALHHHIRINNADDYKRVMRYMTEKNFSVVLGGGGARGIAHLGALQAIDHKNIAIDAIGGTSIGASVAACFAMTENIAETINLIEQFKISTLKSLTWRNMTWPMVSIYSGDPITTDFINTMNAIEIEDLWIPYFAVSANLTDANLVVHRNGLLSEAVRSSGSIPSIFPPVLKDGHLLIDGGILNNLPVDIMKNIVSNNGIILAVSLSKRGIGKKNYQFPPVLTLKATLLDRIRLTDKKYHCPKLLKIFFDTFLLASSVNEKTNSFLADILVSPKLQGFNTLSISPKEEHKIMQVGYEETLLEIDDYIKYHPKF